MAAISCARRRRSSGPLSSNESWRPGSGGTTPDEAAIAAAVPDAKRCLTEFDRLLGSQPFLAGDQMSLADVLLAPQLCLLAATPEGAVLLQVAGLSNWLQRISERPSMKATTPPKELRPWSRVISSGVAGDFRQAFEDKRRQFKPGGTAVGWSSKDTSAATPQSHSRWSLYEQEATADPWSD